MLFCAAIHCSNRLVKGSRKTFHRFPKRDPTLLKEWLVKLRRDCYSPSRYSTLCSDHFEAKFFDRTGQTTRLHPDAIPTIFNFHEHLRKTVKRRKPPRPRSSQDTSAQQPSTSTQATTSPPTLMAGTSRRPSLLTTPTKTHANDHTYCVTESPRSVKRKLDKMFDNVVSLQKRLKSSQKKSRRLRKKVDTLQSVVETLKENNLLSDRGLEMLEATCNVPAAMMKRLVEAKDQDGPSKEKYPPELRAFVLTLLLITSGVHM